MPARFGSIYPGPWDCSPDPYAYLHTGAIQPEGCDNSSGYNVHYVHNIIVNGSTEKTTIVTGSSSRAIPILKEPFSWTTGSPNKLTVKLILSCGPCKNVCDVLVNVVDRALPAAYTASKTVGCSGDVTIEVPVGTWDPAANTPLDVYIQLNTAAGCC